MKRFLVVALFAALVAVPVAAALDGIEARTVLRVAVKLSGLTAREQVRIVVEPKPAFRQRRVTLFDRGYPRARQNYDESVYRMLGLITGGKGTLRKALIEVENGTGVYDPASETAYVQAGKGERATALHEVVHALQDQHFGLDRVARLPAGSDARAAAAAAIEGHAGLVTNVIATKHASAIPNDNLNRFLELERGFAYSVGLRFAYDLRNLGGRSALLGALKRFPATSEQVFHLDKYLERERAVPIVLPVDAGGMKLVGDGSFGELDVRALLAVFDVPRLGHVGTGWGGGRTALYRGASGEAVVVALDWDTARDAAEWEEAVGIYVNEAFDSTVPGLPRTTACAATTCWSLDGKSISFLRHERRTVLVLGAGLEQVTMIARSLLPG